MVAVFGRYLKKLFDLLVWRRVGKVFSQETYSASHFASIVKAQKGANNPTGCLDIVRFCLGGWVSDHAFTNARLWKWAKSSRRESWECHKKEHTDFDMAFVIYKDGEASQVSMADSQIIMDIFGPLKSLHAIGLILGFHVAASPLGQTGIYHLQKKETGLQSLFFPLHQTYCRDRWWTEWVIVVTLVVVTVNGCQRWQTLPIAEYEKMASPSLSTCDHTMVFLCLARQFPSSSSSSPESIFSS